MRGSFLLLGLLLACDRGAAPTAPRDEKAAEPKAPTAEVVRMDGYGALHFGRSVGEAGTALGEHLEVPAEGCHVVAPSSAGQPPRFTLLVQDGVVARIDVRSAELVAERGGRVGMSGEELRRAYAGVPILEEPHKYEPKGGAWIVGPPASAHFVFELDASGRVIEWRAGVPPQIDWVERCG